MKSLLVKSEKNQFLLKLISKKSVLVETDFEEEISFSHE